jgi:hypothetical protein
MKTTLAVLLLVSSVAYGGPVVKCVEPGNTLDVISFNFQDGQSEIAVDLLLGSYEGQPTFGSLGAISVTAAGDRIVETGFFHSGVVYQLPAALFDAANAGVAIRSSFNDGSTASCVATF